MTVLVLEFTVEPFAEGAPGPHVRAALDAAAGPEVEVEFGPFGTAVTGPDDAVLAAADRVARAAVAAGATQVSVRLSREGATAAGGPGPAGGPTRGS